MRILAFPGRLASKAKAPVRDWSTQEIADFYRAHRLLAENGAGIGIDRGLSDEGEPWMVFFDVVSQDVFLHIARIDGTCQLICEPFNMRLDAADIPSLIAQFEHTVRDYLAIRTERAKNVVIHPAARIIMSISAVFLLFKLENGEAYAKGFGDKAAAPAADRATEKSMTALARAQSAFQRAFDAFEPAHAAMIAGLILASELVVSSLRSTSTQEADVEKLMALALADHVADAGPEATALEEAVAANAAVQAPQPVAVELPLANLVVAMPKIVDAPVLVHFTPPDEVVHLAALVAPPAPATPAVTVTRPVQPTAEGPVGEIETDAMRALEYLFTLAQGRPAGDAPEDAPVRTIDISLGTLPEMEGELGFVREVRLSENDFYRLLNHYMAEMTGYEFEYRSGQVLIEELGATTLDESELGVLTNIMADGSTHTIVGRIDLIDDVVDFFG